jgi:hypothetical protein
MDQPRICRCSRCGELKGEAVLEHRHEGIVSLSVICICNGIPCPRCGMRLIRRPISSHYDELRGTVWQTSWFGCLSSCPVCREAASM